MDLSIRSKTVGDTPSWLDDTETMRMRVGGVTIDSASAAIVADGDGKKIVRSGTPLIQLGGGKWEPQFGAADAPVCLLWEDLDVTDGDKHGAALDHGRVREERLPVALHADAKAALQLVGITFR